MLISHKHKFIFIHIQKTAGSSLTKALQDIDDCSIDYISSSEIYRNSKSAKHIHAKNLKEFISDDIWFSYFKFSFVRNPYDRLVSWYNMCTKVLPNSESDNPFIAYVRDQLVTFENFVKVNNGLMKQTAINQTEYLVDDKGNYIVDYVCRFEDLDKEIFKLNDIIGETIQIPHLNKNIHEHYKTFYTKETQDIVEKQFSTDITNFSYSF
jgi:chondroitin 4-sulfotransferase 11